MRHTAQLTHDPLDARQFEIAVRRLANARQNAASTLGGRSVGSGHSAIIRAKPSAVVQLPIQTV